MSNAQTAQRIYDSISHEEYIQVNVVIGPEKSLRLVLENARTVAAIAQAHALERIANLLASQWGYDPNTDEEPSDISDEDLPY